MVCGDDGGLVVIVWYAAMLLGLVWYVLTMVDLCVVCGESGEVCGGCVVYGNDSEFVAIDNDGGFVMLVWNVVVMVGLW